MRRLFVVFCSFFMVTGCFQVERNCADYKTGTFKFNYIVDSVEKSGTFTRSETYSIDYFDNKIDSSSIRWINDCEFILKKINPKSTSEDDPIHMKIIATTDSSYTFEYKLAIKKLNKSMRVEKGTAYRLK